jgi:hypothetical protein
MYNAPYTWHLQQVLLDGDHPIPMPHFFLFSYSSLFPARSARERPGCWEHDPFQLTVDSMFRPAEEEEGVDICGWVGGGERNILLSEFVIKQLRLALASGGAREFGRSCTCA